MKARVHQLSLMKSFSSNSLAFGIEHEDLAGKWPEGYNHPFYIVIAIPANKKIPTHISHQLIQSCGLLVHTDIMWVLVRNGCWFWQHVVLLGDLGGRKNDLVDGLPTCHVWAAFQLFSTNVSVNNRTGVFCRPDLGYLAHFWFYYFCKWLEHFVLHRALGVFFILAFRKFPQGYWAFLLMFLMLQPNSAFFKESNGVCHCVMSDLPLKQKFSLWK